MQTKRPGFEKKLPAPTTMIAVRSSAKLPTTKTPIMAGLIRLPMSVRRIAPLFAACEKFAHARVVRIRQQFFWIAGRDLHPRISVEKDAVVADREDARELVRHDYD